MNSFTEVTDRAVIFLASMLLYFSQADFPVSVAPILAAVIFGGFLCYFAVKWPKIPLVAGFILLAFFFPGLVVFLPVIACDMLFINRPYLHLLLLVPYIPYLQSGLNRVMVMSLALLLLAVYLSYRGGLLAALRKKHYTLLDEAREMSLRLQRQNRELMEKQDNELTMAKLQERNRIAREIHDNVGHLLSSAILQTGALRTVVRDEDIKERLDALHDTLSQAMDSTRKSVHALYEEAVDLKVQLEELIDQFTFCEIRYERFGRQSAAETENGFYCHSQRSSCQFNEAFRCHSRLSCFA